jgi:hypothetical protein
VEQQKKKDRRDGVNGSGTASSKHGAQSFLPLTNSLRQSFLEVQAALAEALPSYMVPTIFVSLGRGRILFIRSLLIFSSCTL